MTKELPRWSKSQAYARWFESPLGAAYRSSIDEVIRPWLGGAPRKLALDAGCGPILTFVEAFDPRTRVFAVDCSLEMAQSARARLESTSRSGAALCASIDKLPFPDGCFDLVLTVNCLEFVKDYRSALAELRRVAAPGASAVVGVLDRGGPWEWTRRLLRPFSRRPYYQGRFLVAAELADGLRRAGWDVLDIRRAVRFPPVSLPRPAWYRRLERWVPARFAGVILVRAIRAGSSRS